MDEYLFIGGLWNGQLLRLEDSCLTKPFFATRHQGGGILKSECRAERIQIYGLSVWIFVYIGMTPGESLQKIIDGFDPLTEISRRERREKAESERNG